MRVEAPLWELESYLPATNCAAQLHNRSVSCDLLRTALEDAMICKSTPERHAQAELMLHLTDGTVLLSKKDSR